MRAIIAKHVFGEMCPKPLYYYTTIYIIIIMNVTFSLASTVMLLPEIFWFVAVDIHNAHSSPKFLKD